MTLHQEEKLLCALQNGLPLSHTPFEDIAADCNIKEEDVFNFIEKLRRDGVVRRFGAVFDTRRLGYKSALCAAAVPEENLDEAAAKLTPLIGVTHCYLREAKDIKTPNLWFTLSYPNDIFDAMASEVSSRLAPFKVSILQATKRYKVDVVFGSATRQREETVNSSMTVTEIDRAIIKALQGDTDIRKDYFTAIADKVGIPEWDLLSTLEMWRRSGRLKRIGLLLFHRNAGYTANGMCCWKVDGDTTEKGRLLAECDEVTHCYERPPIEGFPYNLYAMIHSKSEEQAKEKFARLEEKAGLENGIMLISTKEYKKTSMTFFSR